MSKTLHPPIPSLAEVRIGVVGLGYVGLPLAVEFGKHFPVVGFDISSARIAELKVGHDRTGELGTTQIESASHLSLHDDAASLADCNVFVITVPTPVDEHKRADFRPLISASRLVGARLKSGDVVIYESTVYPGATEEICVPELEKHSGLVLDSDFGVGYSPERINPGDKQRTLTTIPKVTSGSTPAVAAFVDALYRRIIQAGTHLAPSIKVAEASKVVENTQRDVNIALVNEFALIFHRLGIDTHEVLKAASTKWNFLPFQPGLVGGHCIGVDPYYLIQKAQSHGYYPDVLLASRRINDAMGAHVASEIVRLMVLRGLRVAGSRALILGLSFKEDCPDLRNTRVVDLIHDLRATRIEVDVFDPWVDREEAQHEYGLELLPELPKRAEYDVIVLAVAHSRFRDMGAANIRSLGQSEAVLYDIKGVLPRADVDGRL